MRRRCRPFVLHDAASLRFGVRYDFTCWRDVTAKTSVLGAPCSTLFLPHQRLLLDIFELQTGQPQQSRWRPSQIHPQSDSSATTTTQSLCSWALRRSASSYTRNSSAPVRELLPRTFQCLLMFCRVLVLQVGLLEEMGGRRGSKFQSRLLSKGAEDV